MNTTTQQDTQAAANKAAEEGGLPNGGMHDSIFVKVWGDAGGGDAGRRALANYAFDLGRASRQVANKAEVEPVRLVRKATEELSLPELAEQFAAVEALGCDYTLSAKVCGKLFRAMTTPPDATPPATTGASIEDTEFLKFTLKRHMERVAELEKQISEQSKGEKNADDVEAEFADLLPGSYYMDPPDGGSPSVLEQVSRMAEDAAKWREVGASNVQQMIVNHTRAVLREVAAQAGQVAVPEGWKMVPIDPTKEMIWACKEKYMPAFALTFLVAAYKHMVSVAPSPAKESK